MRPFTIDLDPADTDDNGIADDLPTGTAWVFGTDAEWIRQDITDGLAHRLICTTAGNEASGNAPILTVVGTDADGNVQTEAITLPDTTTVESTKYFKTIATLTTQAATISTFDIGWVDEVQSQTYPLDYRATNAASYACTETGTVTWFLAETFQDISEVSAPAQDARWFDTATVISASAVTVGTLNATAVRATIATYTNTGELQVDVCQGARSR